MLLDKKFGPNDILALKLVSGEEIIARFVRVDNDGDFVVARPFVQTLHQMPNGQGAVGFAPFMLAVDKDQPVTILNGKLLVRPMRARSEAAAQYVKATTGLDMPVPNISDSFPRT